MLMSKSGLRLPQTKNIQQFKKQISVPVCGVLDSTLVSKTGDHGFTWF